QADDIRFEGLNPLATIKTYGEGKMAGVYLNVGDFYRTNKNPFLPYLLKSLVESMGTKLLSTIEGSSYVHQVVSRKNNNMYIHLINTSGPHDNPNVMVYDEVPPLHDLKITIHLPKAPRKIVLQPENVSLPIEHSGSSTIVHLPKLEVYSIIEIQD